jgi:hypothetical protein
VKKLISIGVALALLAMAILPAGVAAQYDPPESYAKIPFAIVASVFDLITALLPGIEAVMGELPLPLDTMLPEIADWAYGPLSWTVDMLGWGMSLFADIFGVLDTELGLGMPWIETLIDTIACGIFTPWAAYAGPDFDPCP